MKVSVKSTFVLVGVVLVFACSLPLSSSARVGSHERVVDVEGATVNATETTYKHEDENANFTTGYGGKAQAQGGGTQFGKGINGGPKGAQGAGGSSLQGRCQGGQCGGYGGAQGDCGRGQGGYGGGQGGSYGGGPGGQGSCGGGQGGSSGHGGSEGGFVEPKCGDLRCCYAKYGKCLKCCEPWWVPPGEMNQVVKGKN